MKNVAKMTVEKIAWVKKYLISNLCWPCENTIIIKESKFISNQSQVAGTEGEEQPPTEVITRIDWKRSNFNHGE